MSRASTLSGRPATLSVVADSAGQRQECLLENPALWNFVAAEQTEKRQLVARELEVRVIDVSPARL